MRNKDKKRRVGRPRKYRQPFVEIISPTAYPEIREIVNNLFRSSHQKVKNNLTNIISNLALSPSVAISRSKMFYSGKAGKDLPQWYTYTYSTRAQDELADKGLVTMKKGYRSKKRHCDGYFKKGFSTVLTATETLDNLLKGIILEPVTIDPTYHPTQTLEGKAIEPGELNKWTLFPEVLEPLDKEYIEEDDCAVSDLNNNYFSHIVLGFEEDSIHPIAGLSFEIAREQFKNKSFEERNCNFMTTNIFFTSMFTPFGCGRLYQRCHNSFQHMPKSLRKVLTINGNSTSEVDYTSMHVNLAYFLAESNAKNPHLQDSYSPVVKKLGLKETQETRDAIKKCILVAFNTPDVLTCARAFNYNHRKDSKRLSKLGVKSKDVYEAFLKTNPGLYGVFHNIENKSHHLMFHESSIMKKCLVKAKEKGIYAAPIHDSMVCEKGYETQVKDIMEQEYRKYTEKNIVAEIKG
ncbi:hypothetical protein GF378_02930 [Candidatus Pacearchaeota archaeon]|nr:hypothetical protein [Candidatus Pacearchaeota archaeon]